MAKTETGWSKEDPKVHGVYWWRADAKDLDPDIHSVVAGKFYEIASRNSTPVENYGGEWLGPISPADFEQLTRLRELAEDSERVLTKIGRGVEGLERCARELAAALREALANVEQESSCGRLEANGEGVYPVPGGRYAVRSPVPGDGLFRKRNQASRRRLHHAARRVLLNPERRIGNSREEGERIP